MINAEEFFPTSLVLRPTRQKLAEHLWRVWRVHGLETAQKVVSHAKYVGSYPVKIYRYWYYDNCWYRTYFRTQQVWFYSTAADEWVESAVSFNFLIGVATPKRCPYES